MSSSDLSVHNIQFEIISTILFSFKTGRQNNVPTTQARTIYSTVIKENTDWECTSPYRVIFSCLSLSCNKNNNRLPLASFSYRNIVSIIVHMYKI